MSVGRIGESDIELVCIDLRLHDSLSCRERLTLGLYHGYLLSIEDENIVSDLRQTTDSTDLDTTIGDTILSHDTSRGVDSPKSTREEWIDEFCSGFGFVSCHEFSRQIRYGGYVHSEY